MIPFIQKEQQQSTIEHWKKILVENNLSSFCAFAYVTDSGAAQVVTHLNSLFGTSRHCRWVFGFDYGRSQPTAIRKLAKIGQSEIRIYDGEYVVQSPNFIPRVNYHLKTALTQLENGYPCKQIIGSGNLSASGLLSGIEAGCLIDYSQVDQKYGSTLLSTLEDIWKNSVPLKSVIKDYEKKYVEVSRPKISSVDDSGCIEFTRLFWIDVGYITQNRVNKPGNQFDLPKGSHKYLGLREVSNPELNSKLGDLNILTPTGEIVERTLRFGNNAMEKLTLPYPEDYGYQSYDGKILTFKVDRNEVKLEAFEHDDFFRVYASHIDDSRVMKGGRRYGTIAFQS